MNLAVQRIVAALGLALAAALLFLPVVAGFPLLDLWARTVGVPEALVRVLAGVLFGIAASAVYLLYRRRPRVCETLALLFVAALSAATLAGCLGSLSWWTELYAHFRWQYAAGLLFGALYFALGGRRRLALACAVLAGVNGAIALPQIAIWPRVEAGDVSTFRLAAANVNQNNRSAGAFLRFVARTNPDAVIVVELSPEWARRLAPLASDYPHRVLVPREDSFGIGLYSRYPLSSSEVLHYQGRGHPSIAARVSVAGRPLSIVGTHPPAPRRPDLYRTRNAIYSGLAALTRSSEVPVAIAGDLNSSPWGQSFRRLLEEGGLRDSSEGRGPQWSWPAGFWPLAIPIDHCLVSRGLRVANRYMGPDIGSDHYPLVIDLVLGDRETERAGTAGASVRGLE